MNAKQSFFFGMAFFTGITVSHIGNNHMFPALLTTLVVFGFYVSYKNV